MAHSHLPDSHLSQTLAQLSNQICYTQLVYQRVNKKLQTNLTHAEIETLVKGVLDTPASRLVRRGKNNYVSNDQYHVELVINSFTNRLITVNPI
ncbi:DUF3781 domain-containing protein [Lactiplantibacillus sp. WILCCON 0030]|uniref:DUF3781 domain-containing protein n=1 Tax=Lactiplantibacillus brownii TaxID=3069269 RepID=A0ABU1A964_9LACO|nr:DUF3781 domain-containing protein [Lactiplantibacillus brownii]MDQ7936905.1 DUF3781 domain-containing protein [Lactiplantibacillus brownii]